MAVRLNKQAYDHARHLIEQGKAILDDKDDWSEHQPSADSENKYLESHSWAEYARWYLGVDDDASEETKGRYKFPYGDFDSAHRSGVIAAEARAEQHRYHDIGSAAAHLHGMLDAKK